MFQKKKEKKILDAEWYLIPSSSAPNKATVRECQIKRIVLNNWRCEGYMSHIKHLSNNPFAIDRCINQTTIQSINTRPCATPKRENITNQHSLSSHHTSHAYPKSTTTRQKSVVQTVKQNVSFCHTLKLSKVESKKFGTFISAILLRWNSAIVEGRKLQLREIHHPLDTLHKQFNIEVQKKTLCNTQKSDTLRDFLFLTANTIPKFSNMKPHSSPFRNFKMGHTWQTQTTSSSFEAPHTQIDFSRNLRASATSWRHCFQACFQRRFAQR